MNQVVLFFLVSVGEWFIGILASRTVAKGKLIPSVALIFVEQLTGFWIFFAFVEAVNRWDLSVAYSLGASFGAGASLYLTRNLKES